MGKTSIAWHLETTGRSAVADEITATGFHRPATDSKRRQTTLYLHASAASSDVDTRFLTQTIRTKTGIDELTISVFDTERELLDALTRVTTAMEFPRERLVTYNGDNIPGGGGFALPFLRTCCAQHEVDWVFDSVPHLALAERITTQFNTRRPDLEAMDEDALASLAEFLEIPVDYRETTTGGADHLRDKIRDAGLANGKLGEWASETGARPPTTPCETLHDAHTMLCGDRVTDVDFDPYADETTYPARTGDTAALALHTLADLLRVQHLAEQVEEYACPRYLTEDRL